MNTEDRRDDWIEWAGGECPVEDEIVSVRFRCGDENSTCLGRFWYWGHLNDTHDIVAYRVVQA